MTTPIGPDQVHLAPWSAADLHLLQKLNAPNMMRFLGGPEPAAQLTERHHRYLTMNEDCDGRMFSILLDDGEEPVGSVGIWRITWDGVPAWETGWSVLLPWQFRGIAAIATRQVIAVARHFGWTGWLYAFPAVNNQASNAICRKVGFQPVGTADLPLHDDTLMRCNAWRFDLVVFP
jgi:RimJ/RimL family protein N-acetyltransferase